MKLWRLLLALVWVAAAAGTCHAKQLAIVADTANSTTNLTSAELVKIFNAHTRIWPDGKPITIVLRDPSSADMQLLLTGTGFQQPIVHALRTALRSRRTGKKRLQVILCGRQWEHPME
jgi:hypothetical protein